MNKRVVITGIGPVTSIGCNREEFWNNLLEKKVVLRESPKDLYDGYKMKSKYYIPSPDVDFNEYKLIASQSKKMAYSAKLGVVSALKAVEDANLKNDEVEKDCAVIYGTSVGCVSNIIEDVTRITRNEKFNKLGITHGMVSGYSAWVSILLGLHGINYTINSACSASSNAVGEAYVRISSGLNSMAIVGGTEYLLTESGGYVMRNFDCLTTLTKASDGLPRPFSEERNGFLFNDGYAFSIVMEELEHAKKRNAPIYAEIVDYKANCDGYSIIMMPEDGKYSNQLIRDIVNGTDRKIDYYNAHGTGTLLNDKVEAQMLQDVFGDKEQQPYISSTKGILGHGLGAAGVCEVGVTAMSLKYGKVHGNILGTPIDNLNIHSETIEAPIRTAITASFGFGGHNVGILLQKYEDD